MPGEDALHPRPLCPGPLRRRPLCPRQQTPEVIAVEQRTEELRLLGGWAWRPIIGRERQIALKALGDGPAEVLSVARAGGTEREVRCGVRDGGVGSGLWLYTFDERGLGLGVGLAIFGVACGERALQRHILRCQRWVCAQPVTEAQAALELCAVVHQMEMVGAMRGRGIAQKAPVGEGRIECPCVLVSAVYEGGNRRIEVADERDDVDDRLGEEPRDGGGADVMDLQRLEQRRQAFALELVESRPSGVILD